MRLKILVFCAAAGSNVSMSFGLLQEVTMDSSTQKFKPSEPSGQGPMPHTVCSFLKVLSLYDSLYIHFVLIIEGLEF